MWLAFKNLVWFLFRAILVIVIIAAIGAAIYYGGKVLIDEYILKDVRANRSRIAEIQDQLKINTENANDRLKDFQKRLDALEIQQDSLTQSYSELEAQLNTVGNTLLDHAALLQSMEAYGGMIEELDTSLSSLESQISTLDADLEDIQNELNKELSAIDKTLKSNQEEMDALTGQLEALDAADTLRLNVELLKVMELITRATVSIGQENIGLARDDLQAAQAVLTQLLSEAMLEQHVAYINEISQRISDALENLGESPDLAQEDLEVAWQKLLQGFPDVEPSGEVGATEEVESEAEPTPTSTPTPEP
jgi:chromosome segregation ATPase